MLLISSIVVKAQKTRIDSSDAYLGQARPGNTPEIFASGITAPEDKSFCSRIAISNDGKEIIYSEMDADKRNLSLKRFTFSEGKWSKPESLFSNCFAPSYSSTEDTLFYLKRGRGYNIWYSVKDENNWTTPVKYGENLYNYQETNKGNKYAAVSDILGDTAKKVINRDICKLRNNNIGFSYERLEIPLNKNNEDEGEFFIDKDESFVILGANEGGPGGRDLYISYKKTDGNWTNPKSLGNLINSGNLYKWGPFVTQDKKYLFYSSADKPCFRVYWVRFDNLLESLQHTNFAPYLKQKLDDHIFQTQKSFFIKIVDTTFFDDDNETLILKANLSNGDELPNSLNFDSKTNILSGKLLVPGVYQIKITATDTMGESVSDTFNLTIKERVFIENN